jgi:hypothetical protein
LIERLRKQHLDAHDAFTVVKLIGTEACAAEVGELMQAVSSAALAGEELDTDAWGRHMHALLDVARGDLLNPTGMTVR